MKRIFASPELSTAESVQAHLMENGIPASLSNQNEYNLPSKFGYSDNMQESHPTVWVINDEDLQRAHDLILELDELPETSDTATLSPKQQSALFEAAAS